MAVPRGPEIREGACGERRSRILMRRVIGVDLVAVFNSGVTRPVRLLARPVKRTGSAPAAPRRRSGAVCPADTSVAA